MNQLVNIFHHNTSYNLESINFMVVNLCYEFRVINIRVDSIKHSIQSQHLITYMIHRYFHEETHKGKTSSSYDVKGFNGCTSLLI